MRQKDLKREKRIQIMGNPVGWSEEDRSRINILKVIAMVCVVFIHSYSYQIEVNGVSLNIGEVSKSLLRFEDLVSKGIAACGNSIFFFLSGMLFYGKIRKYNETLRRKIKTLLIPYLFWNSFWIFVVMIGQEIPITSSLFSKSFDRIAGVDLLGICRLYGIGAEFPLANQLWFLRDLIVVTLITPIIWTAADKRPGIAAIAAGGGYILTPSFPMKEATFLYMGAASYIKLGGRIDSADRRKWWKIAAVYFIVLFMSQLTDVFILDNMLNVVSIFTFMYVTQWLASFRHLNRLITYITPYTFLVFALHNIPLQAMKKILLVIFPVNALSLAVEYILLPFMLIVICIITGAVFKRIFPRLYAYSVGER